MFSIQSFHATWIRDSRALIQRHSSTGVVNTQQLKRLIDGFERRIESSFAELDSDDEIWQTPMQLSPGLKKEAQDIYKLLLKVLRENHK